MAQASSSGFTELKQGAEADYNKAKSLLPTLETALQTASYARGPAEDAEAAWQFCHHKLSTLHEKVQTSMAELRGAMVDVAGGDEAATFQLVQHHLRSRMARARAQLEPEEWEVRCAVLRSSSMLRAACVSRLTHAGSEARGWAWRPAKGGTGWGVLLVNANGGLPMGLHSGRLTPQALCIFFLGDGAPPPGNVSILALRPWK
jgi:hypothetical protein